METHNTTRTITGQEYLAILTIQSKWGYVGNTEFVDDLVDMLKDETTVFTALIGRFMRRWGLNGSDYNGIRRDLANLFILRTPKPTFSDKEVKDLESLEGEKSESWLDEAEKEHNARIWQARKELFRDEADKRVYRYFIGRTGWAWFVHFIVDMPENYDTHPASHSSSIYRALDGRITLHMTSLYMSEEKAWERIHEDIRLNTKYDDEILTHVVELDKV